MLNEKNYNVTDVHQWKKRGRTGELLSINIYTITFGACQLPDTVKFGWERVIVKEFIPRPRRCFRCQRYGHNKNKCRREIYICVWCVQELTPEDRHSPRCTKVQMCANCQGSHPSSSKDCIYYLIDEDILTIQTRNKLPYFEAKRRAQAAALGSVRSTSSYSSVLQGRPKNNNTIARPQSENPRMNRSDMRNMRQTIIRDDTIPQQSQEIMTQTNLELVAVTDI